MLSVTGCGWWWCSLSSLGPGRAVYTQLRPDRRAVERASDWLVEVHRPVIVADLLGGHADVVPALAELAELLAAPVVDAGGRLNLPNTHSLWRRSREVLWGADCVLLNVRPLAGCTDTTGGNEWPTDWWRTAAGGGRSVDSGRYAGGGVGPSGVLPRPATQRRRRS